MPNILVVTSFSERLYKQYGHRCIDSFPNWPSNTRLVVYAEDFHFEKDGVDVRDLHQCCPDLLIYKNKYRDKDSQDWRWNATKYANKVFAAAHAFRHHDGIGIWLDADCITYEQIPEGLLETLLPSGNCLSHFRREQMYTETGFWMIDCAHSMAKSFLGAFEGMYLDGSIYYQPEWHDCVAFDIARRRFQARGMKVFNLTPQEYPLLHPMSVSVLAPYIDHTKGARKKLGYSPEYRNRAKAAGEKDPHPVYQSHRKWTKASGIERENVPELEGFAAYESGFKEEDCPYKGTDADSWTAGWRRGYAEYIQENAVT